MRKKWLFGNQLIYAYTVYRHGPLKDVFRGEASKKPLSRLQYSLTFQKRGVCLCSSSVFHLVAGPLSSCKFHVPELMSLLLNA